ncbi:MAG: T9SS type A sorting domain-containing protein [Bacteroidetes bacterium]|nr:MAG: T9SS type A sorting domain-containing protein [Bacteroidota bacterium]
MKKAKGYASFLLKPASTILLCLFIAIPFCSFSQAKLGTYSVNLPSTAYMQTAVSVTVTVTNTGNTVFNGPIDIYYATDTAYVPVFLGNILFASLNPGNSIDLLTNMLIDSSHFNVGSNIVVVWGTSSSIATSGQTWKIINVDTTLAGAGISQLYFDGDIRIYPNPVLNTLIVEYKSTNNTIEDVRIFNLLGSIIPASGSFISANERINVDVSVLPAGIYFLEIVNSAGQRSRVKFVKYSR